MRKPSADQPATTGATAVSHDLTPRAGPRQARARTPDDGAGPGPAPHADGGARRCQNVRRLAHDDPWTPHTRQTLIGLLRRDPSPAVRFEAAVALGWRDHVEVEQALAEAAETDFSEAHRTHGVPITVADAAIAALAHLRSLRAVRVRVLAAHARPAFERDVPAVM
ncbi:MAG: HEAT repeat domain-containing protein [Vicinamibacterales bacterium]